MSQPQIEQSYVINAPVDKVWQAFVDPKIISKWGGGPSKMSDKEGTPFSLWGGEIHGTNTKVVKHKLLEQDWYSGKWAKPSRVRFEFSQRGRKTGIKLLHTDVPSTKLKDIEQGWKDFYLGPISKLFEN